MCGMRDLLLEGLRLAAATLFLVGIVVGAAGLVWHQFEPPDFRAERIGKGPALAFVGFATTVIGMVLAMLWGYLRGGM
jgi:hypothetical protein